MCEEITKIHVHARCLRLPSTRGQIACILAEQDNEVL